MSTERSHREFVIRWALPPLPQCRPASNHRYPVWAGIRQPVSGRELRDGDAGIPADQPPGSATADRTSCWKRRQLGQQALVVVRQPDRFPQMVGPALHGPDLDPTLRVRDVFVDLPEHGPGPAADVMHLLHQPQEFGRCSGVQRDNTRSPSSGRAHCAAAGRTRAPAPPAAGAWNGSVASSVEAARTIASMLKNRANTISTRPTTEAARKVCGRPISPAEPAPAERADGERAVLRQLVDRQCPAAHPGRADQLRRRLDRGEGRGPAEAEQQHPERRRHPVVGQPDDRHADAGQQRADDHRAAARQPAAHHRQQHAGGDAADPHHAEDDAIHARPEDQVAPDIQRQQRPGRRGRDRIGRRCAPSPPGPPGCCARSASQRASRR